MERTMTKTAAVYVRLSKEDDPDKLGIEVQK